MKLRADQFLGFTEHLPFRSRSARRYHESSNPKTTEASAVVEVPLNVLQGDLFHKPDSANDPEALLAESMIIFERDEGSPEVQKEAILEVVVRDAENLAAHLLPNTEVEALGLYHGTDGASILDDARQADDVPPSLRETILLARAYDVTHDDKLLEAITYILDHKPPRASDELEEAIITKMVEDEPIMRAYQRITAGNQEIQERSMTPTPSQLRFVELMKRADRRRVEGIPTKNTGDVEATGPQG